MTVGALLDRLSRAGISVAIDGPELVLRPGRLVDAETIVELRAHKYEIIDELQKRETVLAAARLLRESRWPQTAPVCDSLIGHPGERCQRCGAPWIEHYPAPVDGAAP